MSRTTSITAAVQLAALLEPAWPDMLAELHATGVPLAAGDPEAPSSDQPPPGEPPAAASQGEPAATATADPAAATEPPAEGQPAVPEQLAPLMDRLTPLLEPDEDGHTMLEGLLEFYELTGDENRQDEFEKWWEKVGNEFGFLSDDGEPAGGDPAATGDPAGEDPRDQKIAELEQRLNTFEQQGRATEAETQVQEQLSQLMSQHGIQEDRSLPEEKWPSTRILRLALSYEGDIEQAVAEYLDLTGQAQQAMLNGAGEETATVGAPGPSLSGGSPDMAPESVQSWDDARKAAMARVQNGGLG